MQPRTNELTAVSHREWFDAPPNDTAEVERWRGFREAYHRAADLECGEFPLQIDFELNSTCQMKCAFCVHGYEKVEKRSMSFAAFRRVIDEGAAHGLVSIKLNYINEPLLNRDIAQYIEYARKQGVINVYFATNGLLLNEDMSRKLIDAGLSKLMVSLDATTPETFLKVRKSKHFRRIVDNIHRFLEIRGDGWPKVRVNFLETPLNAHESESFVRQWEGVADMLGFQQRVGLPGMDGGLLEDGAEFKCSFPFKLCVVDSAGYILPCCTFSGREMPIGHIEHDTIHAAWNGERMNALRELHRQGRYRDNSICKHCVTSC